VSTEKMKISAYITRELRAKADELAKKQNRTLSNLIESLLIEAVEQSEKSDS